MAKEKSLLFDLKKLEKLIDETGDLDDNQIKYLRERWLHRIAYWHNRSREAKNKYFASRCVIIIGGILVPYLTSVQFSTQADLWIKHLGFIVSLVVAISAGLEALFSWGAIWLQKRRVTELLTVEGWLFLERSGSYKNKVTSRSFPEFVTEVESMVAAEIGEYVAIVQKSQNAQRGSSDKPDEKNS